MFVSSFRYLVTFLVCISLVFSPLVFAADLSLPSGDLIAPKVIHKKVTEPLTAGSPLQIKAIVKDNVGVQSVTLFYRTTGETEYKRTALNPTEVADEYSVTLGPKDLAVPGIEYYIQAMDLAGNTLLHAYSFSPLNVKIIPDSAAALGFDSRGQAALGVTTVATTKEETTKKEKSSHKWLWITLGVLAAGALAAAAGSGGGDSGTTPSGNGGSTLIVTAPAPGN